MTTYRSIVKDAYSTRDPAKNVVEIAAWKVRQEHWVEGSEGREGVEDPIKDWEGNLRYGKILADAMDEIGAEEIARRTALKSYRDDQGGRAASTVRGYKRKDDWIPPKKEGGYPSSHPVKRVLRRYARSQDKGHFEDDTAGDEQIALDPTPGRWVGGQIDLEAVKSAYRLARMICSKNGIVFVSQSGEGEAIEDNERIDADEIRRHDRPVGDMKAACVVEKADGYRAEYWIDLDNQKLERADDDAEPPSGWGR